jgi:hypothetical protein
MPKGKPSQHAEILEYALSHLETERDNIQSKIDAIRQELRTGKSAPARKSVASAVAPATATATAAEPRKKRVLSEAARKRIAAAQKRRWAEHRKQQKAG